MLLRGARQVPGVPAGEARMSITINEADLLSAFLKIQTSLVAIVF